MELNSDLNLENLSQKQSRYYTRLVVQLSLNTFLFSLYYHNIPLLVIEDDEASNATNFFVLLNKDTKYRSPIQTYFYHVVPISSLVSVWLSDLLGRKQVLQHSIKWNIVFLFFACVSLSPYMLIVPNLCMGLNFANGLVQAYLLASESVQLNLRHVLTGIMFVTWGLAMFVAYFLNYLLVDWKVFIFAIVLANFFNYFQVKKLVESPQYFRDAGNEARAEENLTKIRENLNEDGEWEVVERIRRYEGIREYLKDFGDNKKVLLVLWFNSALVYNTLYAAGITVSEDLYVNGMIVGVLLCVPMALGFCLRKAGLWNLSYASVLIGRTSLFFLSYTDREKKPAEFFYLLGAMGLVYEIFTIFSLTQATAGARVKAKMFGLLIFFSLASNFLIKQNFFPEQPSTSPCLLVSLITSTSLICLYYLKLSKPKSLPDLSPTLSSFFELKPLT